MERCGEVWVGKASTIAQIGNGGLRVAVLICRQSMSPTISREIATASPPCHPTNVYLPDTEAVTTGTYVVCQGQGGHDALDIECSPVWNYDSGSLPDSAGDYRD